MGFKSSLYNCSALLITVASLGAGAALAGTLVIEGKAHVVDAATVEIWGQRIRLTGIAVPDAASQDGESGRRFLQRLLADVTLRCTIQEASFRTVASGRCFVANVDIVEPLVQMGYARRLGEDLAGHAPRSNAAEQRHIPKLKPAGR